MEVQKEQLREGLPGHSSGTASYSDNSFEHGACHGRGGERKPYQKKITMIEIAVPESNAAERTSEERKTSASRLGYYVVKLFTIVLRPPVEMTPT